MLNTLVSDGIEHSKFLFMQSYGNYANNYSLVKADGDRVFSDMVWVLVIAIIAIVFFGLGKGQITEDNKKNSKKSYHEIFEV